VASPYGFHLFQLIDRRASRSLLLEEARPEIERKLQEQKSVEAESYYMRTLRERATIERDLNLLDAAH
jgi:parvulin-like peptidyl-prolyl isomerase